MKVYRKEKEIFEDLLKYSKIQHLYRLHKTTADGQTTACLLSLSLSLRVGYVCC